MLRPGALIGIAVILMGLSLIVLDNIAENVEYGGVVLIGPIPIVFGSSSEMAGITILIAAIFFAIMFLMWRW
jgi:uncharacterized protein (TIGR00304 family)